MRDHSIRARLFRTSSNQALLRLLCVSAMFAPFLCLASTVPAMAYIAGHCVMYCGGGSDMSGLAAGLLGAAIEGALSSTPETQTGGSGASPAHQRAVELNNEGIKYGNRCVAEGNAGRFDLAIQLCEAAIKLYRASLQVEPGDQTVINNLKHSQNNLIIARHNLTAARLKLLYSQADMAFKNGNLERGLNFLRQALRIKPGDKQILQAIASVGQRLAADRQAKQQAEQQRLAAEREARQREVEQQRLAAEREAKQSEVERRQADQRQTSSARAPENPPASGPAVDQLKNVARKGPDGGGCFDGASNCAGAASQPVAPDTPRPLRPAEGLTGNSPAASVPADANPFPRLSGQMVAWPNSSTLRPWPGDPRPPVAPLASGNLASSPNSPSSEELRGVADKGQDAGGCFDGAINCAGSTAAPSATARIAAQQPGPERAARNLVPREWTIRPTLAGLMMSCQRNVTLEESELNEIRTACNWFVARGLEVAYNVTDFIPADGRSFGDANALYQQIKTDPRWHILGTANELNVLKEAMRVAAVRPVVAVRPDTPHGHILLILPGDPDKCGELCKSDTWGWVPQVASYWLDHPKDICIGGEKCKLSTFFRAHAIGKNGNPDKTKDIRNTVEIFWRE